MSAGQQKHDREQTRELFARIELFKELDGNQLNEIVDACEQVRYSEQEALFEQGDESDALFIIGAGRLEVIGQSQMGEKVVLAVLEPGTVVGEMSLIEGGPRSATVRAVEDSLIYRLSHNTFDQMRRERRAVAYHIILSLAATVGDRRRHADHRVREVFDDPASHIDSFESQLNEMLGQLRKS